MLSEKNISAIKERSQNLKRIIDLDDNNKITEIQSILASLKDDDDSYFLGHLYALLIESYLKLGNSEKVVFYTNKLILISGMAMYEYCGNFCPFSKEKVKHLFECYEAEEKSGNYAEIWGKGRLLQLQNKPIEAIAFYQSLIKKNPDDFNAYRMCARVYEEMNDFDNAREYFSKSEQVESNPLTLAMEANIEINQFNFTKALSILNDTIEKYPESSIAKYRLNHVLGSLYKKDEQKLNRKQLIEENPANIKYILFSITEYNEKTKIELNQLLDAVVEGYDYTPIQRCFGDYYYAQAKEKNENKAIVYYEKAIEENRFSSIAYQQLIKILTKQTHLLLNENKVLIEKRARLIYDYHKVFPYDIENFYAFKYADDSLDEQIIAYEAAIKSCPINIASELYAALLDLYLQKPTGLYREKILSLCETAAQEFKSSFVVNYRNFLACRSLKDHIKAKYYIDKCAELSGQNKEIVVIAFSEKYYINPELYHEYITADEEEFGDSLDSEFYLELAIAYFNKSFENNNSFDFPKCSLDLMKKAIKKDKTKLESPEHCLVYSLLLMQQGEVSTAHKIYARKTEKKLSILEQIKVCGDIFDINILYKLIKYNHEDDILFDIDFWTYLLLHLLQYNLFKEQEYKISHYTSLAALNAMLSDKGMSPFRLCSLGSANDPKEGRIIYDFLVDGIMDKDSYLKIVNSQPTAYTAVQASFTKLEDALTMFRLYGKKDKNEGTGVNLIFNENFFSREIKTPLCESEKKIKSKITVNQVLVNDEAENRQEPLYWILYWDKHDKMYFNPQGIYKTLEIDLTHNTDWYVLNNEQDEFKNSPDAFYAKYAKNISFVLNKLKESFVNYFNNNDNLFNLNAVKKTLLNISYLIKDVSFYDEKELRIIKVQEVLGNETLKHDDSSFTLYAEYTKLSGFYRYPKSCALDKIIIGPKVEQKDTLREYLLNHLDKAGMKSVKVEISQAPLA